MYTAYSITISSNKGGYSINISKIIKFTAKGALIAIRGEIA